MCGTQHDGIMLVDGKKGTIIRFDPKTKKYGKSMSTKKLGAFTSSIMIKGNVHIIHGNTNSGNNYFIHSLSTGQVHEFKDKLASNGMQLVSVCRRSDDGEFYKFGGFDCGKRKYVSSFYIGSLPGNDPQQPIIWRKTDQYRLIQPMAQCGVIQYGQYILTFGGKNNQREELNEIYCLNLRQNRGWSRLDIRCPMKSRYIAALDHLKRVHLFTFDKRNRRHFSIALNQLLPDQPISPIALRLSSMGSDDNDDAPDEKEDSVQIEIYKFSELLRNSTVLNKLVMETEPDLRHSIDSGGSEDSILPIKMRKHSSCPLYMLPDQDQCNNTLQAKNMSLKLEVERLETECMLRREQHEIMERKMTDLMVQNEMLTAQHVEYQKDAELRIRELEDEVKELKMQHLDISRFREWSWNQIHLWMMSLDGGRFRKYDGVLMHALSADKTTGHNLLEITPYVLRVWGIKEHEERYDLSQHIQGLVQQNDHHHHHHHPHGHVGPGTVAMTIKQYEGWGGTDCV